MPVLRLFNIARIWVWQHGPTFFQLSYVRIYVYLLSFSQGVPPFTEFIRDLNLPCHTGNILYSFDGTMSNVLFPMHDVSLTSASAGRCQRCTNLREAKANLSPRRPRR